MNGRHDNVVSRTLNFSVQQRAFAGGSVAPQSNCCDGDDDGSPTLDFDSMDSGFAAVNYLINLNKNCFLDLTMNCNYDDYAVMMKMHLS